MAPTAFDAAVTAATRVLGFSTPRATKSTTAGWTIVSAAAALGVAADVLLRAWPWGINATIWIGLLCAATVALQRFAPLTATHRASAWLAAAFAFSLMLAWRASPVLHTLNAIAVFACLGMVAFPATARALSRAGVTQYAANFAVSCVHVVGGAMALIVRDLDWRRARVHGRSPQAMAFGRGVAFAVVPVVVFTSLFASADVFFRGLLHDAFVVIPEEAVSHIAFAALFAWLAGGYLWGTLVAEREPVPDAPRPSSLRLDVIEIAVVFALINGLFLLFVAVQFNYLFGGADHVEASSSLTYAEYARRGFFELVTVAALVVVFLLITHWLLPHDRTPAHRLYSAMAAVLVVLVFVVMASALERMRLYTETFGLTELRLYTTAFMAWLVAVFVWLALTLLRGRRDRFAFGALLAGLAVVAGLNAANPDALIVRRNASLDRPFDSGYALNLSADAVPALVANLDEVPPDERCGLARELRRRYLGADDDWRSWSWGRARAHDAVVGSTALTTACG